MQVTLRTVRQWIDNNSLQESVMIKLRPYQPGDAPCLLTLFRDTIQRVNSRDYNERQIRAWASDDIDPVAWANRFAGRFVVVAELAAGVAGFAELEPDGHIDRVYVSAGHQGLGVGRKLLEAILAEAQRSALPRLFVEASITARPFFESQGFTLITPQTVTCRGVEFVNFRMERLLDSR